MATVLYPVYECRETARRAASALISRIRAESVSESDASVEVEPFGGFGDGFVVVVKLAPNGTNARL